MALVAGSCKLRGIGAIREGLRLAEMRKLRTTLIERDPELCSVDLLIDHAVRGNGGFALYQGGVGLGKTCVLDAASQIAESRGLTVLRASGRKSERQYAYGLVRQWIESHIGQDFLESSTSPLVVRGASLFGEACESEADLSDFAVLHDLYGLVVRLSRERPIVLVADDLHWADRGSLRFLAYLQPRLCALKAAVVAAVHPDQKTSDQWLLDHVMFDPACQIVRLRPLSVKGTADLLTASIGRAVDEDAASSCQRATGGNPRLLSEVAQEIKDDLAPSDPSSGGALTFGLRALEARIALRLNKLPAECEALAAAVAVLGDDVSLAAAARLADLRPAQAARVVAELQRAHVFDSSTSAAFTHITVRFVHPVVQKAVYEAIGIDTKVALHLSAARQLGSVGANAGLAADHLLRVPAVGDRWAVGLLRLAAEDALHKGEPVCAVKYLERCALESLESDALADTLAELGKTTALVNSGKAVDSLRAALDLVEQPTLRIELASTLGLALNATGRNAAAVAVYRRAIEEVDAGDRDARQRLQAGLFNAAMTDPTMREVAGQLASRWQSEPGECRGIGARLLDGKMAFHAAMTEVCPTAADRAMRCLDDGKLVEQDNDGFAFVDAIWVMLAADRMEVMHTIEHAIAFARQRGSVVGVLTAKLFRALGSLWKGDLNDAEADLVKATEMVDSTQLLIGRPYVAAFLADVLMEQGRLVEASAVLADVPLEAPHSSGAQSYWLLDTAARLALLKGEVDIALRTSLLCGDLSTSHGWLNPAFLGWRSTAAVAMWEMGDFKQARDMAFAELALARQWSAPRALGRALRTAASVHEGTDRLAYLREADVVLRESHARLERAKTLVDLGVALRDGGQNVDARQNLFVGLDLAHSCGALGLAGEADAQLRASGARPRRPLTTGVGALTPSERRSSELAAAGLTNRQIAAQLFVTAKTVEVHLGSSYRKLGVAGREQLGQFFD
ncbi:helix-turn-helix transcriptional regulator [Actinokineospora sp. HUAS TT18]|uniref:helix-turn-helix transcriptional regulator n=1 Tax=Actinokineospora sp. HUAS TT18 TaxID=3447451 RepID=UPI003F525494